LDSQNLRTRLANCGRQITGVKFKIISVEIGHSQARTGSRLNHVNIVVIDNSVRFDIVPKI